MGGCSSSESGPGSPAYGFDFGSEPLSSETEVWAEGKEVLAKAPTHLRSMTEYKGCDALIRNALSTPSPENEQDAMKAVQRSAEQLYDFYEFSYELQTLLPRLLASLSSEHAAVSLSERSATVFLLAQMFHFAFHFDELKMLNPAIQNDFSYYRRTVSRAKAQTGGKKVKKLKLSDEVANQMSFHYAYPTPVMKVLINAAVQMSDATQVVPTLAEIANVACQQAAGLVQDENRLLVCLMTGCIILIDHVSPAGAFHKKSPVRTKQCIQLLVTPGNESLCNSIRFSTLHLTDDSTPANISRALGIQ